LGYYLLKFIYYALQLKAEGPTARLKMLSKNMFEKALEKKIRDCT